MFENVSGLFKLWNKLDEAPVSFDESAGIAVAKIIAFFGVSADADAAMITSFIHTLLQNWRIVSIPSAEQVHAVRAFVQTFGIGSNMSLELRGKLKKCATDALALRLVDGPRR